MNLSLRTNLHKNCQFSCEFKQTHSVKTNQRRQCKMNDRKLFRKLEMTKVNKALLRLHIRRTNESVDARNMNSALQCETVHSEQLKSYKLTDNMLFG